MGVQNRWMMMWLVLMGMGILGATAGAGGEGNSERGKGLTEQDKWLGGLQVFPKDDEWNRDVSKDAVDVNSAQIIAAVGLNKPLHPDFGTKYGIPFNVVDAKTPRVQPKFQYAEESDKGPYPIPDGVLIEGVLAGGPEAKGDRHILCIDKDTHVLYEMWSCWDRGGNGAGGGRGGGEGGPWECGSGAIFDLTKKLAGQRPKGWTSADAAGLAIFPGLVRYDEVCIKGEITHALRFTISKTRGAYVAPATHCAATTRDEKAPPMGMRVRLRADFDVRGFPPEVQVILQGLKKYGMILADNGSDWFISGAPDERWNDEALNALKRVHGRDLEVVKMGAVVSK